MGSLEKELNRVLCGNILSDLSIQEDALSCVICCLDNALQQQYVLILLVQLHSKYTVIVEILSFLYVDATMNDTAAEGTVRLVGGITPLEGRVEIFLLGQWGTVCDYNWDFADARVVCLQLGYPRPVGAPRSAAFGAGSGPSWYNNVRCAGTEMNLTECSKTFSLLGSACSATQYARVMCSGDYKYIV